MRTKGSIERKLKESIGLIEHAQKEFKFYNQFIRNKKAAQMKKIIPYLKLKIKTLKWVLKQK